MATTQPEQSRKLTLGDAVRLLETLPKEIGALHSDAAIAHIRETRRWIYSADPKAHAQFLAVADSPKLLDDGSTEEALCKEVLLKTFTAAPLAAIEHAQRLDAFKGLNRSLAVLNLFRTLRQPDELQYFREMAWKQPPELLFFSDKAAGPFKGHWDGSTYLPPTALAEGSGDPSKALVSDEELDVFLKKTNLLLGRLDRIKMVELSFLYSHAGTASEHYRGSDKPFERDLFAFASHLVGQTIDVIEVLQQHYLEQTRHNTAVAIFGIHGVQYSDLTAEGRQVFVKAGESLCDVIRQAKDLNTRLESCVERWLPELVDTSRFADREATQSLTPRFSEPPLL